jgi:integrase-like protein
MDGLHVFAHRHREVQVSTVANAYCERLVGTVRRECLDFIIPLNERHLRRTLRSWVAHYNRGRLHASFGPGITKDARERPLPRPKIDRHKLPPDCQLRVKDIMGGPHIITNTGWNRSLHEPDGVSADHRETCVDLPTPFRFTSKIGSTPRW